LFITVWKNLVNTKGNFYKLSWSEFATKFKDPRQGVTDKRQLPGWAPTSFLHNRRSLKNALYSSAMVFDIDRGTGISDVLSSLRGFTYLVHSSFSSDPQNPRWRVVLPLVERVTPDQHCGIWHYLADKIPNIDVSTKDPSRLWYAPAVPPNGYYAFYIDEGEVLNYDPVHHVCSLPSADVSCDLPTPTTEVLDRARAYIASLGPAISGQGGAVYTFKVCQDVVRGFGIKPDIALSLLEHWRLSCKPHWTKSALRDKLFSAWLTGRRPIGYKLGTNNGRVGIQKSREVKSKAPYRY
jgi:hypothetical protein